MCIRDRGRLRQQRRSEQRRAQQERRQQELMALKRPWTDQERLELNPDRLDLIEHWLTLLRSQPASVSQDADLQRLAPSLGIGTETADLRQWLVVKGLLDPDQPLSLGNSPWSKRFSDELEQEAERLIARAEAECPGDTDRLDLTQLATYSLCLLYTSPSPRDQRGSRMPSSA